MSTPFPARVVIVKSMVIILLVGSTGTILGAPSLPGRSQGERQMSSEPEERSGGSYLLRQSSAGIDLGPRSGQIDDRSSTSRATGIVFDGFDFDDNPTENDGFLMIPPDPMGAAGTDRVIAVVNSMIEARDKTGALLWRDALQDMFSPLVPLTSTFDPKIVYDHYENRFVVITLERVSTESNPDPGNDSRILLAVSKTATPSTATFRDWYYHEIDASETINGWDQWLDYPGFEVDEEAIYLLGRMFAHTGGAHSREVRLWIVDKGVAGGFYGGGPAAVTKHDPYGAVGLTAYGDKTTMPAQVYGAGGVGPGVGTFLTQYDGITAGGPGQPESLLVIRVDNPIGAVAFTAAFVDIGDIEDVGGVFGWPALPDAPQLDTEGRIDVNDRRVLDAVWRGDRLWMVMTIMPNSGPDAGEPTAHWIRLDTSSWPPTLDDQGDIGGEDLHPDGGVYTFFPALAVNAAGDAAFGFAASSPSMYCGAYVTGREAGDAAGTVRPTNTIRAGVDYYVRTFGGSRNRWGDYSGASLDPTDDNLFWIFNEYALTRGTVIGDEDGRWGTAWASFSLSIVPDPPALPADQDHQASKNRYLTVDLSINPSMTAAYQLTLTSMKRCEGDGRRACNMDADCPNVCDNDNNLQCFDDTICGGGTCLATAPCGEHPDVGLTKWVGEPFVSDCVPLDDCADQWFAGLVDTALYRVWTEDTVHITDCGIIPAAVYEIRGTADGVFFGDTLEIGTTGKPQVQYADCVGPVISEAYTPPDGFTNVTDVQAYLVASQGGFYPPHTTWVDLHSGSLPVVPQQILNIGDLQTIKFGFLGQTYVETPGHEDPSDCP